MPEKPMMTEAQRDEPKLSVQRPMCRIDRGTRQGQEP
jgi:hypothetical protein